MKIRIAALISVAGMVVGAVIAALTAAGASASAVEHQLPGMCNGRSDAEVLLIAHANGKPSQTPKYILNLATDASGVPSGTLIVGKGPERLMVQTWCRSWQHRPGDEPGGGQCEGEEDGHDPSEEGAITAHAVGLAHYRGQQVLVRTDVRSNEEGMVFRVRYRAIESHSDDATHDDEGCAGGGWTNIPAEGWAPLDQLMLRVVPD